MREHRERWSDTVALLDQMATQTIEHVRGSGIIRCDADELNARKQGAKARIYSMVLPPINEEIGSDRERAESRDSAKSAIKSLTAKREVLETRLTNAREQTARMPEPSRSLARIAWSAIGLFIICFSPTLLSVFMSSIQDAPLAWLISIILGAAVGAFLVQILLQPRTEADGSKHSSRVGFGIGIGFGVLRMSKADGLEDYCIAVGLTILECVAVAALDRFAEKHCQCVAVYRTTQAQSVALEQAIGDVKANIQVDITRYDGLRAEVKQRESEVFDVERVAEQAGWAVEAAYRGAIHANQRILEGGGGFALPRAS